MAKGKVCRKKQESKDRHLLEHLKKADGRQEDDIDNERG